jgi:hypothetical protein
MKNFLYCILGVFTSLVLFSYSPSDKPSSSEKGFKKIFDGKSLDGWEGDPTYWRVENGSLIGEITPANLLKRNTFIIYRKEQPANFELKCEVKITKQGNTGINYRSVELLPDLPLGMRGYQADIDGANRFSGQNYEERGRTTLAYRGEIVTINEQTDPALYENVRSKSQRNAWVDRKVNGSLGHTDSLKTNIKSEDWNEVHIIANGNRLQHFVNGVLMSDVTDLDEINGKKSGFIGVQVHVGPPMKVEYRNIRLKKLK